MTTDLTSDEVKKYGKEAGADLTGIAASEDFGLAPDGFKPADVLAGCHSVIVLGTAFLPCVLKSTDLYSANRNAMLSSMTDMAKVVAKRIKASGYSTKVISAAGGKWIDGEGRKEQVGFISLKHAAEIAGLGVIGKNYLLTNPQYGNLIWLSAVLTNAKLIPDKKIKLSAMCRGCNKCVEACPVKALDEITSFGKKGCSSHYKIENGKLRIKCFLCRTVCPYYSGTKAG